MVRYYQSIIMWVVMQVMCMHDVVQQFTDLDSGYHLELRQNPTDILTRVKGELYTRVLKVSCTLTFNSLQCTNQIA